MDRADSMLLDFEHSQTVLVDGLEWVSDRRDVLLEVMVLDRNGRELLRVRYEVDEGLRVPVAAGPNHPHAGARAWLPGFLPSPLP